MSDQPSTIPTVIETTKSLRLFFLPEGYIWQRQRNDKSWRKAKPDAKVFIVLCNHPGIKGLDCGCSRWSDCNSCEFRWECPECGLLRASVPSARVYLEHEWMQRLEDSRRREGEGRGKG